MQSRVLARAEWHDVKMLVSKVAQCHPKMFFVHQVEWSDGKGWLIECHPSVDIDMLRQGIFGVLQVGKNTIVIGVLDG